MSLLIWVFLLPSKNHHDHVLFIITKNTCPKMLCLQDIIPLSLILTKQSSKKYIGSTIDSLVEGDSHGRDANSQKKKKKKKEKATWKVTSPEGKKSIGCKMSVYTEIQSRWDY